MSLSTLISHRATERNASLNFRELTKPLSGHRILFVSEPENHRYPNAVAAEQLVITGDAELGLVVGHGLAETAVPCSLTLTGESGVWHRLLTGELVWPQACNPAFGMLKVSGDPVLQAWATPALTALFSAVSDGESTVLRDVSLPDDAAKNNITGHYVMVDGSQAYYETLGSGPAILLLHTAGRDGRQWHPVMRKLAQRHRVYATDLPGHGKSWPRTGPAPCFTEITEIADWLLTFMAEVGESEFFVAGTSVGGNLALLLPALSSRVRGAVAFQGADLTPTVSPGALDMMRDPRVAMPFSARDQAMTLIGPNASAVARRMISWSIDEISSPAQHGDLSAYTGTDTRALMPQVTCPVLLVHGEHDWLATSEMVEAAARRLINADVRMVTLPGIGHYPHVEAPDQAAELILEFTQRIMTE